MSENYYRTGQVAKQLGASSYQIRRLCECGLIDAELTAGNRWRVPASEVARLKRDGVPPVPQSLTGQPEASATRRRYQSHEPAPEFSEPEVEAPEPVCGSSSDELIRSAEEVSITENFLRKRKVERNIEEVEDFFREREQRRKTEVAAERQRALAIQIQNRRDEWRNFWLTYALNSTAQRTPKEAETQIFVAVESALSRLNPDQPRSLVKRLVDAAVQEALAPWSRAQKREDALKTGLEQLPFAVKYNREFTNLRQRARSLIAESVDRLSPDATDWEMCETAKHAAELVRQEYEHRMSCRKLLSFLILPGATPEELDDAREAVRTALSTLQVGSPHRQLEKARDSALVPFRATIAEREKQQRTQTERTLRRFTAEMLSSSHLKHIERYLREEFEFDGGHAELARTAERLREPIRKRIAEDLIENPQMTPTEVRKRIETITDLLLDV